MRSNEPNSATVPFATSSHPLDTSLISPDDPRPSPQSPDNFPDTLIGDYSQSTLHVPEASQSRTESSPPIPAPISDSSAPSAIMQRLRPRRASTLQPEPPPPGRIAQVVACTSDPAQLYSMLLTPPFLRLDGDSLPADSLATAALSTMATTLGNTLVART